MKERLMTIAQGLIKIALLQEHGVTVTDKQVALMARTFLDQHAERLEREYLGYD